MQGILHSIELKWLIYLLYPNQGEWLRGKKRN
jgi:hypothetical protein